MTHEHDGPIGVFLIGMRFNRLHRPDQWVPVFMAMPRMLAELYRNKAAAANGEAEDLGFLRPEPSAARASRWSSTGAASRTSTGMRRRRTTSTGRPGPRSTPAPARRAGAVGIWHETYAGRPAPTRASTSGCR